MEKAMVQRNSLCNPYFTQLMDSDMKKREKEEFIRQYSDLVKYMALRMVSRLPSSVQADDLFNAGIIGLIDAIDKFDAGQGIQFETYAKIRVRGAMLDEVRAMDWVPRSLRQKSNELAKVCALLEQKSGRQPTDEEVARHLGVSLNEYYKLLDDIKGISFLPEDIHEAVTENEHSQALASDADQLFDHTYRQELRSYLAAAIGSLSKKEQLVLSLYYYEELTMKEIGAVLGYTESRISQIHTKAVLRLRTRLSRSLKREDLPEQLALTALCG
jgi:RNA polymerase sigma factor for flagellar operon FliA